jgi:hypothetical protein
MVPRPTIQLSVCLIFLCLGSTLASAAEVPYTDNFDSYPNGGVPANFVETTDAEWAISSNGTTGSYVGSTGIIGGQKSSSTLISLDNIAGHNFTFRTKFSIRSVSDFAGGVGKFVDLGFTGPGYELVYKAVAGGSVYTNQFYLTGNSVGTYLAVGTKPCEVVIHGAYVGADLFLTAQVSDGVETRSMRTTVAASANNTKFGYTQSVGGSSGRPAGATVSYDDFSVLLETFPAKLANVSTRVNAGNGEEVPIAGFVVTGNSPKRILVRGLGGIFWSLNWLPDPVLELRDNRVVVVARNDNWRDTQKDLIRATQLEPFDDRDSALIVSLPPGEYTALLRDKNGATGLGLIEIYDLDGGGRIEARKPEHPLSGRHGR